MRKKWFDCIDIFDIYYLVQTSKTVVIFLWVISKFKKKKNEKITAMFLNFFYLTFKNIIVIYSLGKDIYLNITLKHETILSYHCHLKNNIVCP